MSLGQIHVERGVLLRPQDPAGIRQGTWAQLTVHQAIRRA